MSDLSVTIHNLADLLAGKTDFNGFKTGEAALIQQNIHSLPPAVQPSVQLAYDGFMAGVSSLVGAGQTALGPLLSQSTDQQATMVLNLLTLAGVPAVGPLSIAERAAATVIINGLKTGLDKMGLHIATNGTAPAVAPSAPAPTPAT